MAEAIPTKTTVGSPVVLRGTGSSDPDGDPLTWSWSIALRPAGSNSAIVSPTAAQTSFVPDVAGIYTIQLIVRDGKIDSVPALVVVEVLAANHPPVITSTAVTSATAGQPYSYPVKASDPDVGDVLTWSLVTAPSGMTIDPASGLIAWTPSEAQVGSQAVSVRVSDQGGLLATQDFAILVAPPNHPPVITFAGIAPQWTKLAPTGAIAAPRHVSGSNTYDEINDRLITFGGDNNTASSLNDTWVLVNPTALTGAASWLKLEPAGTIPAGRHSHSAIYDPTANRLIIYGGCVGHCTQLADAWVLTHANGLGGAPEWIALPSGMPSMGHAVGYDPVSNRMIVFGGLPAGPGSDTNAVRVLVDANGIGTPQWITLTPDGTPPSPRGHWVEAAYDPTANRLLVYGGRTSRGVEFNDMWILHNANGLGGAPRWEQLAPNGSGPSLCNGYSSLHDLNSNRLMIHSGVDYTPNPNVYFNETWILTNANGMGGTPEWIKQTTAGVVPAPRAHFVAGYARSSNRMVLAFGRSQDAAGLVTVYDDAWVLSNASGNCTAGQPCTFKVTATDPDVGDALRYSFDAAQPGMVIDAATGAITWTPAIAQIGNHAVTVRVNDRGGLFATQSFRATVAPVAVPNVVGLAPEWAESFITAADLAVGTKSSKGGAVTLSFDSLPSRQGWTFDGQGGIEAMFSVADGVLKQNTMGGGDVSAMYALRAVDPRLPFQLASRIRVLEGPFVGVGLYAETDNEIFAFFLNPHAVLVQGPSWTTVSTQDNTVFHDYLLERYGSDRYNLLVDGTTRVRDGIPVPINAGGVNARLLLLGDPTITGGNARAEYALYRFTQPRVVGQNPPAGTLVPNKTAVDLTIVDGPATETVPNVIGLSQPAAETAIVNANLKPGGVTSAPHPTIPAGQVSDQSPLPNIHVPKDTPVAIVMSTGPPAPVNVAPIITSAPVLAATAGQPYGYQVTATDPDAGDVLTYSLTSAPTGMTINTATGLIAWTPGDGQVGNQNVTVRVTDKAGLFASQTFAVTVAVPLPVNHAPVAVDDAFQVSQESAGSTRVISLAFDRLPSAQGWTFATNNARRGITESQIFSLCAPEGIPALCLDSTKVPYDSSDGSSFWYVRRDADLSQPHTILVRARMLEERFEGSPSGRNAQGLYFGAYGTATLSAFGIGIDPPRLQSYANGAAEVLVAFDPTQWHDYRMEVTPTVGFQLFVDGATTPLVSGPGTPDSSGPFLYFGDGTSFNAVRAEISRYTFIAQPTLAGNVLGNDSDPDGDPLTARLLSTPGYGTVDLKPSGDLVYVPAPGFAGIDSFQYRANDGKLDSNPATVTLTVVSPNHPPAINSAAILSATAGQPYAYQVTATDPDVGDVLAFSLPTAPAGMTINATTGLITWTSTLAQVGNHNVTVRVTDPGGLSGEQSFIIAAGAPPPVNQPPSITSTPLTSAIAGQPYAYQVMAADPDAGDVLTFTLPTAPAGMTINATTGLIAWTPTLAQLGSFSVTVRVTDAGGLFAEQSFTIAARTTNGGPIAVAGLLNAPGLPACVAPPAGLVSWYPGDGNANDIVGPNSPNVTIGSPQFVAGKIGQAMRFDGSSGFRVPSSNTITFGATDSFSIDTWVRVDGRTGVGDNAFLDKFGESDGRGYYMSAWLSPLSPTGKVKFSFTMYESHSRGICGQVLTRPVPMGEEHFVVGVANREKQTIAIYTKLGHKRL